MFLRYGPKSLWQSDCSIFKWMKSPEQINDIASFFACWYQFKKIKFSLITFLLRMAKNGCGQSGYKPLKLNVSREWAVERNWFFAFSLTSILQTLQGNWAFFKLDLISITLNWFFQALVMKISPLADLPVSWLASF